MENTQKPEKTRKPKARDKWVVIAVLEERLDMLAMSMPRPLLSASGGLSPEEWDRASNTPLIMYSAGGPPPTVMTNPHVERLRELIDELKRSLGRKDEEA